MLKTADFCLSPLACDSICANTMLATLNVFEHTMQRTAKASLTVTHDGLQCNKWAV